MIFCAYTLMSLYVKLFQFDKFKRKGVVVIFVYKQILLVTTSEINMQYSGVCYVIVCCAKGSACFYLM